MYEKINKQMNENSKKKSKANARNKNSGQNEERL